MITNTSYNTGYMAYFVRSNASHFAKLGTALSEILSRAFKRKSYKVKSQMN